MLYSKKLKPRYATLLFLFDPLASNNLFQDYDRTREIYQTALNIVPPKIFTFTKLWLMFAKFEVRRLRLPEARKILGTGIGLCPEPKLFQGYIDLEVDLREFDRVRRLYEKFLEVCLPLFTIRIS